MVVVVVVWYLWLESFKGGNFNTLSLVDCYVQICNDTAVEHGSLLNCSGVCDGINWNHKINHHHEEEISVKISRQETNFSGLFY